MQTKFLFISAIDPAKEVEIRYPPLGIGYLVGSLRKHFGEDAIEFKVVDSNIEQEIISFKPDIVGISSVSQNYNPKCISSIIALQILISSMVFIFSARLIQTCFTL